MSLSIVSDINDLLIGDRDSKLDFISDNSFPNHVEMLEDIVYDIKNIYPLARREMIKLILLRDN